jgi:two-component system, OmpR family, response regulator CpxR
MVLPSVTAPLKGEANKTMRPKKTILCVDDNEQTLSVRKFMLETRGYRVLTALGSEQALELFRDGGIDLVLSDLIMPYMDGNELVRRMKELVPEVPTILISGSVKAFDRANRADAFLPKGACSPGEMLERIRVMVARKRGPKKGHALRPLVVEHQAETSDRVVVSV